MHAEMLERQWTTISRAKLRIEPEGGFYFLQKSLMLEYGLSAKFKERIDLATLANGILCTRVTLSRCQKALKDFESLFLPALSHNEDTDIPQLILEPFLYLIVMALALAARKKTKGTIRPDQVLKLCNSKTIPSLGALRDANVTPVVDLAAKVAMDKKLSDELYNDIMEGIIALLRQRLQALGPPDDKESYDMLTEDRIEEMKEVTEAQGTVWSGNETPSSKKWLPFAIVSTDAQPDNEKGQEDDQDTQSLIPSESGKDDDPKESVGLPSKETTDNGKQRAPMPSAEEMDDAIDFDQHHNDNNYDQDVEFPTPAVRRKDIDTNQVDQNQADTSRANTSQAANSPRRSTRTSKGRPFYFKPGPRSTSEEFEGGDDIPLSPPSSKKRAKTAEELEDEDAYLTDPENRDSGSDSDHGHHKQADKSSSSSVRTGTSSDQKKRKTNRHWTPEEVTTLMRLANMPTFRYSESDKGERKRNIKWARLQDYDAKHGNVLRHRTQVQLKDKYRYETDNGEHGKYVSELAKKKNKHKNFSCP
ncbi:hypothetical protein BGZ94_002730 [Podila epigama]|nr:hypothetical protein BGZ94_002730 [Podila epigama]